MKRVAIESPYKPYGCEPGTAEYWVALDENERFAAHCCHDAIQQGLNPFAMHLFFTRFLDDTDPVERNQGIACGLDWTDYADLQWFCLREGEDLTPGMQKAVARNVALFPNRPMLERRYKQLPSGKFELLYEAPL